VTARDDARSRLRDAVAAKKEGAVAKALLAPFSALYGFGARLRAAAYETGYLRARRLSTPVVSVGNLTFGGTGKTPLVQSLAAFLRDEGYDVAILTRGYGRRSKARELLRSEAGELPPDAYARGGDEPALLARELPGVAVVVDRDRYESGRWAERELGPDVFLLDDGFQHLQLSRDLNILVVDATDPFGGLHTPPLGRLREPIQGAKRADAVVVTRADRPFDDELVRRVVGRACGVATPIYYAWHDIVGLRRLGGSAQTEVGSLRGQRVVVLTGLGNPSVLLDDLERAGIEIVATRLHADHHDFTRADIARAVEAAGRARAQAILVTEKDAIKLEPLCEVAIPFYAVRIAFRSDEGAHIQSLCLKAIRAHGKVS
jgi:tetraacyldisaccharide 4'-kinase